MAVRWHPSPNFTERRGGLRARMIVLHYTAMETPQAAIDRLCSSEFEVSAHYLIDQMGQVVQMVADDKRAWHAGRAKWMGETDINSASIGIELCNTGGHPFPLAQMTGLITLLHRLCSQCNIHPHSVWGHSDIAIGRKTDPGPRFDWQGLARSGFGVWPQNPAPSKAEQSQFCANAQKVGYDISLPFNDLLAAFRLHFAPWRTGPLVDQDCAEIADLAAQITVDERGASA